MSEDRKEAIGVILISHCHLAEEMLRATELITGSLRGWKAISLHPHQTFEEIVEQLREAIKEVDQGRGILIFTDLFGGTPANISIPFMSSNVEVVCGMNLPMLIKLAYCQKDYSLAEAALIVKEYGRRHISLASEVLSRSVKTSPRGN